MENSFWGIVGIRFTIKSVVEKTLADAISAVCDSNDYCFYGSRWFIDIKGNFKIFSFNGTSYIAKETSNEKADLEVTNSLKAKEKLDGKIINTKRIKVVVPQKITLPSSKERYFLVSEYLGSDMNDGVYTNTRPSMSLNDCLSIVKLLLENGIAYRGFLPRNIVEKEDNIYLFDWEDASFTDSPSLSIFDHLWRTNFLLNWSYLYKHADLANGLIHQVGIQDPLTEPPLVKYEETFKVIFNSKLSDRSLRDAIDKIVFGSELPLAQESNKFYIRPNDMGHLIADVFFSDIDVLHDLLSSVFRMYNEGGYLHNLQLLTSILIAYYREILVFNRTPKLSLEYYALVPILLMIDDYLSEEEYLDILDTNTLSGLMVKISTVTRDQSIANLFLKGKIDKLKQLLEVGLQTRIVEAYRGIKSEEIGNIDKVTTYMQQISAQAPTEN